MAKRTRFLVKRTLKEARQWLDEVGVAVVYMRLKKQDPELEDIPYSLFFDVCVKLARKEDEFQFIIPQAYNACTRLYEAKATLPSMRKLYEVGGEKWREHLGVVHPHGQQDPTRCRNGWTTAGR